MSALRYFPRLEALDFTGATAITDAGLAQIEPLSHLQTLDLMQTSITDAGLSHLQGLTELRELSLGGTPISDASVPILSEMKYLESLDVRGTKISSEGYEQLKKALPKTDIQ